MCLCHRFRGVFQTLVEKHFPAPDRRKTMDLFSLGSVFDNSPIPSPKTGLKRKHNTGWSCVLVGSCFKLNVG